MEDKDKTAAARLHNGAEVLLGQAIKEEPSLCIVHTCLAVALDIQDDHAGAAAAYSRAIDINPNGASAYSCLGLSLGIQGDFAGAAAAHRRVTTIDPNGASAHSSLGDALFRQGNHAGAATTYSRSIAIDPNDASARQTWRRTAKTKWPCRQVQPLHTGEPSPSIPTTQTAHRCLGAALGSQGDVAGVAAACQAALAIDPQD
jgi:Flp pilus assembly protein TadD